VTAHRLITERPAQLRDTAHLVKHVRNTAHIVSDRSTQRLAEALAGSQPRPQRITDAEGRGRGEQNKARCEHGNAQHRGDDERDNE
jgi:hypothetical protein